MRGLQNDDPDETRSNRNLFGFIAVVLLVAVSLLVLLRFQHFNARRSCYQEHVGACGHIGSGRNPHY